MATLPSSSRHRALLSCGALVAAGGALGALARWGTGQLGPSIPVTLAVNVTGCLALGLLVGRFGSARPGLRLFLGTGVLGGFTTFSTAVAQVVPGVSHPLAGAGLLLGSLAACLLAAWTGLGVGAAAARAAAR